MAEAILIDSLPARVDLSIVVVTWNSERWVERCLRAIPAACGDIAHEVIVYDKAPDVGGACAPGTRLRGRRQCRREGSEGVNK